MGSPPIAPPRTVPPSPSERLHSPPRRPLPGRTWGRPHSGLGPRGAAAARDSNTSSSGAFGVLERSATPVRGGAGDQETTPRVLEGLVFAAAEDKASPEVQSLTSRLAERFPGYASARDVLNGAA